MGPEQGDFCQNPLYTPGPPGRVRAPNPGDTMKVLSSLSSMKRRHADCQVVKRNGTLYVINKTNPRFKARQGATRGTKLSKKGVS